MMRAAAILALSFAIGSSASAQSRWGLPLCVNTGDAAAILNNLSDLQRLGLPLNLENYRRIADRVGCPIVVTDSFLPIDTVGEFLKLRGGGAEGWVTSRLYVMFMNPRR